MVAVAEPEELELEDEEEEALEPALVAVCTTEYVMSVVTLVRLGTIKGAFPFLAIPS